MSDVVNPKVYPQLAAQQLVIELIRAGKLSTNNAGKEARDVIAVFDEIEKHFSDKYESDSDSSGIF